MQSIPANATVADRRPLVYEPESSTLLNVARLPPPEELEQNALQFRPPISDAAQWYWIKRRLIPFVLATPVALYIVPVLAQLLGPIEITLIATLLGIAGAFVVRRIFTITSIGLLLTTLLAPGVLLFGARAAAPLLQPRVGAAFYVLLLAGVALLASLLYSIGKFHLRYIEARPADRATAWRETYAGFAFGCLLLLVGALFLRNAAAVSTRAVNNATFYIPLLGLVAMGVMAASDRPALIRRGIRIVIDYLTAAPHPPAPGLFHPGGSLRGRRARFFTACAVAYLVVPMALQWYRPHGGPPSATASILRLNPPELTTSGRTTFDGIVTPFGRPRMEGDTQSDALFRDLFGLLIWGLTSAVIVNTMLAAVLIVGVAAPLAAHSAVEGDTFDTEDWDDHVARLRTSPFSAHDPVLGSPIFEAEHLLLGIEPAQAFPVLLHQRLLAEHTYIVGDSGSGKTSLGLIPIVTQLLRGHRTPEGATTRPAPMVVLDLKGDMALFESVRLEAEARGQQFLFFTPEPGVASHSFNPFNSFASSRPSLIQLSELLLDALSLNHGEGYGRSYYSRQSRMALFAALKDARMQEAGAGSFDTLREILSRPAFANRYKDIFELLATIEALSEYPQLITTSTQRLEAGAETIHMPTLLRERQVAYFWLPAAVESISVREIGKLALYTLLAAAIDRQRAGAHDDNTCYVVIDEFQRVAGENFKLILEQARSFGLGLILANQSLSDLRTATYDLRSTVTTNTRVKIHFSVQDAKEIAALSEASGEELTFRVSTSTGQPTDVLTNRGMQTLTEQEQVKPRLTPDDIRRISDHPLQCILHVSRGSGYTQFAGLPIPVQTAWPMPLETYRARLRAQWPTAPPPPTRPEMTRTERRERSTPPLPPASTVKERQQVQDARAAQWTAEAMQEHARQLGFIPRDNRAEPEGL